MMLRGTTVAHPLWVSKMFHNLLVIRLSPLLTGFNSHSYTFAGNQKLFPTVLDIIISLN
jgi:hypothetical protein